MPKLLKFSETSSYGAAVELDNGEVVYVSIAQVGMLVRLWNMKEGLFKSLMSNYLVQDCTAKEAPTRTLKRRGHSALGFLNKLHPCISRTRC
jgi:hypothetical protein